MVSRSRISHLLTQSLSFPPQLLTSNLRLPPPLLLLPPTLPLLLQLLLQGEHTSLGQAGLGLARGNLLLQLSYLGRRSRRDRSPPPPWQAVLGCSPVTQLWSSDSWNAEFPVL